MTQNTSPNVIAIDWGTSSFRAYLVAHNGKVMDQKQSDNGILNVANRDFDAVLHNACEDWLAKWPNLNIVMCGMIGSKQGWKEATYLSGDTGAIDLANAVTELEWRGRNLRIVPGVQAKSFGGGPDVMRGEETILVGALSLNAPKNGLYCLPGTHSKWVLIENGKIGAFSTFMTGELFSILKKHSILSALISEAPKVSKAEQDIAFLQGIDMATEKVELLHELFSLRAGVLTGDTHQTAIVDVLSGLLIGSELISMKSMLDRAKQNIILVSSGEIAARYHAALTHLSYEPILIDAEKACISGLLAVSLELPETALTH